MVTNNAINLSESGLTVYDGNGNFFGRILEVANQNMAITEEDGISGNPQLYAVSVSQWIVCPTVGQGTHTTITDALADSSAGDNIFIRAGTYEEDLTLIPGVNLTAWPGDGVTGNVTIKGKCLLTTAGQVVLSGLQVETNGDYACEVSGNQASVLYLKNCMIDAQDHDALLLSSSSPSSQMRFSIDCSLNLAATGICAFTHSGAGLLLMRNSVIASSAGSTTPSTVSGTGVFMPRFCNINTPVVATNSGVVQAFCSMLGGGAANFSALTVDSIGSNIVLQFCNINTGTASAVVITSGVVFMDTCQVSSSNAHPITGAGQLINGGIVFVFGPGGGTSIDVVTQLALPQYVGAVSFDGGQNFLGNYAKGTWTPDLKFGGGNTGVTYSTLSGYYERIGTTVNLWATIALSNKGSSTGVVSIDGLPFTSGAHSINGVSVIGHSNVTMTASYTQLYASVPNSGTALTIGQMGSAQAAAQISDTNCSNTSAFYIQMSYTLQ